MTVIPGPSLSYCALDSNCIKACCKLTACPKTGKRRTPRTSCCWRTSSCWTLVSPTSQLSCWSLVSPTSQLSCWTLVSPTSQLSCWSPVSPTSPLSSQSWLQSHPAVDDQPSPPANIFQQLKRLFEFTTSISCRRNIGTC